MSRTARFSSLFDPSVIDATVVGVGAVGRQVALMLAAMGVRSLTLYDFDIVSVENLGTQGFCADDIGKPKSEVTIRDCLRLNPDLDYDAYNTRFTLGAAHTPYIFLCVDSMDSRAFVVNSVCPGKTYSSAVKLLVDTRMSAETFAIETVSDQRTLEMWHQRWFADAEAQPEPCTRRSTNYCAAAVASFAVSCMTRHLRLATNPDAIPIPSRLTGSFNPPSLTVIEP